MSPIRILFLLTTIWAAGISSVAALPLWEIEGTTNTVRILGSIHFLRPNDYPLPDSFDRAYEGADIIVFEVDLANLNPLEAQAVMQRMAVDPDGRQLEEIVGAGAWRSAQRKAAAIDIDLALVQIYEPWFAALQITQLRLMQLGFDPGYGIEARVILRAGQDGKQVKGLETLEEQLATLDSLPTRAQSDFLIQTLEEAAAVEATLDDIVAAWRRGDTTALERELLAGLKDQRELYQSILVRRNRNWTRQILEFTRDSRDYLIVVGTLHLVGQDSVLAMLEDQGFESQQVLR